MTRLLATLFLGIICLIGLGNAQTPTPVTNAADCLALGTGCACLETLGCGMCLDEDNKPQTDCLPGSSIAPSATTCAAGDVWWGDTKGAECKEQSALQALIGPIICVVVGIVYLIFWWCVRGKWWWHSTSHKRCCCHPQACCNGCCCCHPYEPNPPPHGEGDCCSDGPGHKSTAKRVAPCWPQNPCAACRGGNPEDNDLENHPCGIGLACDCEWIPGCCCFHWPAFCVTRFCLDEQPTKLDKTIDKVKAEVEKVKGRCFSLCGKKGSSQGPPPQQQGHQQYGGQRSAPPPNLNMDDNRGRGRDRRDSDSFDRGNYGRGGRGGRDRSRSPPRRGRRYSDDYSSYSGRV